MTEKFRPSIIHYSSVVDIEKILDELIEDLGEFQKTTLTVEEMQRMLIEKKEEVQKRYEGGIPK